MTVYRMAEQSNPKEADSSSRVKPGITGTKEGIDYHFSVTSNF
jgi:hypothetical protein